jgi:type II secretory pathway pseudopilin PulG
VNYRVPKMTSKVTLHNLSRGSGHPDRGDTLVEVLITLIVVSITAVALLLAFSTAILSSNEHRNLANNNSTVWNATETVFSQIQQGLSTNFQTSCSYSIPSGAPSAYTVTISYVKSWVHSTTSLGWTTTCPGTYAPQLIAVTVTKISSGASDTADIVVERSG